MAGYAWVTLATNDAYSLGALVLAHSLRRVGTKYEMAVLVTPGVTQMMREKLAAVFSLVQEVNVLDSKDEANLALLARPELGITFTKLHCWRLTQYDKCVFLDADTLVVRNCDELFEREELSAAPDVGWPDCFNSGVFVYKPSQQTFASITSFAAAKGSFDGGDQGLLNLYFKDWARKDISKHLPFIYNMCSTAVYSYLPAFKQFGEDVRIIHFIGMTKPWLQYFDTLTGIVQPPAGNNHLQPLLQLWWNIFCEKVHPQLSPVMATSTLAPIWHEYVVPEIPPLPESIVPDFSEFVDPWENYCAPSNHHPLVHGITQIPEQFQHFCEAFAPTPIQSYSSCSPSTVTSCTSEASSSKVEKQTHACVQTEESSKAVILPFIPCERVPAPREVEPESAECQRSQNSSPQSSQVSRSLICIGEGLAVGQDTIETKEQNELYNRSLVDAEVESKCIVVQVTDSQRSFSSSSFSSPFSSPRVPCTEFHNVGTQSDPDRTEQLNGPNAGLAGALAQMTLGEARSAEQIALEEHLRKQSWEQGQIDYMGRDSFDNIWKKICLTLSEAPSRKSPPKETRKLDEIDGAENVDDESEAAAKEPVAEASLVDHQQQQQSSVVRDIPVAQESPDPRRDPPSSSAISSSFPAAEEATEKRIAEKNSSEEESTKTSIQATEQSPAIPLPTVPGNLLKKSEEEEKAASAASEEKVEEEESKVRKVSLEPRETVLSEQHAEMLSTASELQTVSPVPIQVAESVLEASPKESVSRDLPESQGVLATTVTPVHESVGVAAPLKFEMNGSERLDLVSLSEKEEKELEIPERPTRVRELNIPATPTVTEATPPTSPPILSETPSLQEASSKSEDGSESMKKSEEEVEKVKKSEPEAETVKKSEEATETVKKSEEEAEAVKKSEQEPETPEGDTSEKKTKKTTKKVVKKTKSKSEEGQEEAAEGSSSGSKQKKTVKVVRKGSKGFLGTETTVPETPPPGGSSKEDAPVPPKRKAKTTAKSTVQKKPEQSE